MQRTVIALMHDRPGVLNRVVSLFRRRSFNIDSLSVAATETTGLSRMTVVVEREEVTQVVRQLERLVDVISVRDVSDAHVVEHELCLVRVRHPGARLGEVLRLARNGEFGVVDATPDALVIAIAGPPHAVSDHLSRLSPFGIVELTRSGRIVMPASSDPHAQGAAAAPVNDAA